MADYWKSQPRHFCEICKCWFGDNRASIDFHESGKRHQENAKKQLREARQRTADKQKVQTETAKTLAQIEMAAMQAYQRDLAIDAGIPVSQPTAAPKRQQHKLKEPARTLPAKQQKTKSYQSNPPSKPQATSTYTPATPSSSSVSPPPSTSIPLAPPPPPSPWQQLTSPEGYIYYHNIITETSQWEPPPEFQELHRQYASYYQEQQLAATSNGGSAATATSESDAAESRKRTVEGADVEEEEVHQRPKRPAGPYGGWSTVAERIQEPRKEEKEDETTKDKEDDESTPSEDHGMKFEERQLPTSSSPDCTEPVSFKGFGFKKRAGGTQKRPQLRQRTSEL